MNASERLQAAETRYLFEMRIIAEYVEHDPQIVDLAKAHGIHPSMCRRILEAEGVLRKPGSGRRPYGKKAQAT